MSEPEEIISDCGGVRLTIDVICGKCKIEARLHREVCSPYDQVWPHTHLPVGWIMWGSGPLIHHPSDKPQIQGGVIMCPECAKCDKCKEREATETGENE